MRTEPLDFQNMWAWLEVATHGSSAELPSFTLTLALALLSVFRLRGDTATNRHEIMRSKQVGSDKIIDSRGENCCSSSNGKLKCRSMR